jgi:hypothetical protein
MQRSDYYTLTFLILLIAGFVNIGVSTLYENYLEGRIIYNAVAQNSSVMIGNDSCFTSIWDDTINFTCGGSIPSAMNFTGVVELNSPHCELWNWSDPSIDFSINDSEIYYNLTMLEDGDCEKITYNNTAYSKMIITEHGTYSLNFYMSFTGGNAGLYGFGVAKNGEIMRNCYTQRTASGSIGNQAGSCNLHLEIGDIINLQVDDENAPSQDISIYSVGLSVHKI